jgi:hypothetical protein
VDKFKFSNIVYTRYSSSTNVSLFIYTYIPFHSRFHSEYGKVHSLPDQFLPPFLSEDRDSHLGNVVFLEIITTIVIVI